MTIVITVPESAGDAPSGAILVSAVVAAVGKLLLDEGNVRWPQAEKIDWINEAMAAILQLKPQAFAHTEPFVLQGGTYQLLPLGSAMFIGLTRNLAVDGMTPGRAIRPSTRSSLDDANPDWHSMAQTTIVRHFMPEASTPRSFYVYPPALAGVKVELQHAVLPSRVSLSSDAVDIAPEYFPVVVNYVAYRCNLKDSEYANATVANLYYQAFLASLGLNPTTGAPQ